MSLPRDYTPDLAGRPPFEQPNECIAQVLGFLKGY
jgi:hypothetical protein